MNKTLQDYIKNSYVLSFDTVGDVVFDSVFVIPSNEKHSSGYRIMYVFGKNKGKLYFLCGGCDVVSFKNVPELRFDTDEKGVTHYWNRNGRIKCDYAESSCDFHGI